MPMVRGMRMLNAVESGSLTGSTLESLIVADMGRKGDLRAIYDLRGQCRRIANNEDTVSRLCGSDQAFDAMMDSTVSLGVVFPAVVSNSTAATAICQSDVRFNRLLDDPTSTTALSSTIASSATAVQQFALRGMNTINRGILYAPFFNQIKNSAYLDANIKNIVTTAAGLNRDSYADITAVAASSTAMSAVAASSTAMTALSASIAAKTAVFNSDVALDAIANSATAINTIRLATQYAVYAAASANSGTTSRPISGTNAAASYIVVGISTSDTTTGVTITISTKRTGTTRPATHIVAAGSNNSTAALGSVCCPIVTPFNMVSTDTSTSQTLYAGLLRCDVQG